MTTRNHGSPANYESIEVERQIASLAAQTGRDKEFLLREIAKRGLEDVKDYYLAAEVLERVRAGLEQVHSAEDVMLELCLDN